AVCLDTCHLLASGYDIRDADAYDATMAAFDEIVGLAHLKVVHANDSQKPLASRVDRHAHIGEGEVGLQAFRILVNDPRLRGLPIIVETPDAETMHAVNVQRLRDLVDADTP
ncbi:MAG: deoxyribonuclease IV, partial [Capsulimonadaceae bacterium]